MTRGLWIAIIFCLVSWAILGTGIGLLVVRYQQEAPQWYQESSIEYRKRLPRTSVDIKVAKMDRDVMKMRVATYIIRNGGTILSEYNTYLRAEVRPQVARAVGELHHPNRGLSPDYKLWPDWASPEDDDPQARPIQLTVEIIGVPYSKLMLDLGVASTVVGAIAAIISTISLCSVIDAPGRKRRRAASRARAEEENRTDLGFPKPVYARPR